MSEIDVIRHGEGHAEVRVPPTGPGERIDKLLAELLPELSRSRIQKAIGEEEVTVDGRPISKSYAVEGGETIRCRISRPEPMRAKPQAIPLSVVYEDEHLIVVDKPADLVVHPAPGHPDGTLVNALLHYVGAGEGSAPSLEGAGAGERPEDEAAREEPAAAEGAPEAEDGTSSGGGPDRSTKDEQLGLSTVGALDRSGSSTTLRPGIVHRLDRDTTGLLVVAKTDRIHRGLAEQFRAHTVDRQYQALLWGVPEPEAGTIDAPVGRDPTHRTRMAVTDPHAGKEAVTHYRMQETRGPVSLVAFQLETGRTHQIRVHSRHLGHPVFGDPTYGGRGVKYGPRHGPRREELESIVEGIERQALHARVLGFRHPITGEQHRFLSDWPDDMLAVWRLLGSFGES